MSLSALGLAMLVVNDLEALGYENVEIADIYDTSAHKQVICVRKDDDGYFDWGYLSTIKDYHFMRQDINGSWYHKPGRTNPLKYKYSPSDSVPWICEFYDGNVYGCDSRISYDSLIWYVVYDISDHEYEYEPCSSSQHILTCTICGDTEGSAMSCVYLNGFCKFCGAQEYTQLEPNKLSANTQEE